MVILANIPSLLYLFLAYNIIMLSGHVAMDAELLSFFLISGAEFKASVSDLFLALGVVALYAEVFKATRISTSSIIEHSLSMLLFVAFLIEFIVVKGAGTSTFLILTLIQMIDVVAGFTITISTARRDLTLGEHR